jgi:cell division transport system permease protein
MLRGDTDISVYLDDDIHPADRALLEKDLRNSTGVREVRYVSAEQALQTFRVELGDDAELLDALRANPLPASFEVKVDPALQNSSGIDDLVDAVGRYPGVDTVVAQLDWLRRLESITRAFVWADVVVGLLVLLSSLFVISNTVRLAVEESSETVAIMKLVGATNAFIRTPFVFSGALQGAAAGALAMVLLTVSSRLVRHHVEGLVFFDAPQLVGFVTLSTVLGAVGSMVALRRHLRI